MKRLEPIFKTDRKAQSHCYRLITLVMLYTILEFVSISLFFKFSIGAAHLIKENNPFTFAHTISDLSLSLQNNLLYFYSIRGGYGLASLIFLNKICLILKYLHNVPLVSPRFTTPFPLSKSTYS